MTVKAKRGRRRYVYFVSATGDEVGHEDLVRTLIAPCERAGLRSVKLMQFDGRAGIIRSSLKDLPGLKQTINGEGTSLFMTVRTSGTIRTLRERYFKEADLVKAVGRR